jgi:hypothetical protein
MEDFERWLIDELEIQTLTDELKDEILERIAELYSEAQAEGYSEGYSEAKHDIIDHLTYNM